MKEGPFSYEKLAQKVRELHNHADRMTPEKSFWPIGNEEEVLAESLRRLEAHQEASIDATLTDGKFPGHACNDNRFMFALAALSGTAIGLMAGWGIWG